MFPHGHNEIDLQVRNKASYLLQNTIQRNSNEALIPLKRGESSNLVWSQSILDV
ncbi:hypothetical protein ACLOJK_000544 [Asimina triloba]